MMNVVFLKDYEQFKAGDTIKTTAASVDYLIELGIVEKCDPSLDAPLVSIQLAKLHHLRREQATIKEKPAIILPHQEMDSAFVRRLSHHLKTEDVDLFWEPAASRVVEINEWYDKQKDRFIFGKRFVDSNRLKSILEERFFFEGYVFKKNDEPKLVRKSASKNLLDFTMTHDEFRQSLQHLSGVFESPFLYIKNGNICVTKTGYNEECAVYIRKDAPEIKQMSVAEAKQWLSDCLIDFPFQSDQDRITAMAAIITPMLRGIYNQYGIRTPVFAYLANQQGCGKDYCAGIRHIIYTGKFNEDAPLSNDKGSNSEEIQKEYVSAAITGQQFMHNSNCRGRLENAAYEKQTTSSSIRGRALGTNTIIDSENIIENSFSGNYGLTFNKDLARRALFINLFTDVEDTTKRTFTKDLHEWVRCNRSPILSAIYTLIKTWWDAGHQPGSGVNASYSVWARFCSGVMQYHGLGDPCAAPIYLINDVGGDVETKDICALNLELGDWLSNPENSVQELYIEHEKYGLVKKDIFSLIGKVYVDADDRPFARFNLDEPRDRREFGRVLNKYVGTFRGGYKLMVASNHTKLDRVRYKLVKNSVLTVPSVPTLYPFDFSREKYSKKVVGCNIDPVGTVDPLFDIARKLANGDIFEIRPGVFKTTNSAPNIPLDTLDNR